MIPVIVGAVALAAGVLVGFLIRANIAKSSANTLEAQARQDGIGVEEARQRAASKMPLQRIATPQEVADVVVYLSSARASYVSGSILNVDGASSPAVV